MGKKKFDFEWALEQLDEAYGLPLYSFTLAEVDLVLKKVNAIRKAMVEQNVDWLPDLLDD